MFGTSNAGSRAASLAGSTGADYGAQASGINSTILPFLTQELQHPQGFTQQQTGSMLAAAEGGAGGSTAGLTTEANLENARNRNSGGFSGALDEAARQKDKALAGTGEGIAAQNATLEQTQQQEAAKGLQGEQGMDQNAQLKAMGLVAPDLQAQAALDKSGWAGQLGQIVGDAAGVAGIAGGFGIPGFGGFKK